MIDAHGPPHRPSPAGGIERRGPPRPAGPPARRATDRLCESPLPVPAPPPPGPGGRPRRRPPAPPIGWADHPVIELPGRPR